MLFYRPHQKHITPFDGLGVQMVGALRVVREKHSHAAVMAVRQLWMGVMVLAVVSSVCLSEQGHAICGLIVCH